MEILSRNLHAKLQEMCDCYLETDFPAEMRKMTQTPLADLEEEALKYLSLALLHMISEKATELKMKKEGTELRISLKNEDKELLPVPPVEIFDRIFEIIRTILHLEEAKGELPLSLGLRNGQVEMLVKVKRKAAGDSLKFKLQ
jgi:hypothetical protein